MLSTKGSLLISQPGLLDPSFRRTVVLVTEHNEQGAFGLVLNRRGAHRVADLWESLSDSPSVTDSVAFYGGPVQPSSVFLLHTRSDLASEHKPVVPGLYFGSDVDLLARLLEAEELRLSEEPDEFRVFCGYSGWGPEQLDNELTQGGWIVQDATTDFIFGNPPDLLWQKTMGREGGVYTFFSFMPPKPELN